jgi:asparagine synthase (glutamine-hydrolysing)
MFAFAIYDPVKKCVFLARDRVGVKPLFYCIRARRLLFASSIAALRCLPGVEGVLDLPAVSHYLTTLRTTLGRRTLLKGVNTLLPGEYLIAEQGVAEPVLRRYWDIDVLAPADKLDPGLGSATERVRELMTESVREQLVSDVPLGGFLSGGLDSSVIAALASRLSGGRFGAYSVGYDLEGYHEWPYVRQATEFHHMTCREMHLDAGAYPGIWNFLIGQKGLPLSTPNEVPIFHLAQALKQDFTVALSGEGADEVFGGYVMSYFSAYDFDRARHAEPAPGEPLTAIDRAMRRFYRRPYFLCLADHYFLLNSWIPFSQKQSLFTGDAWKALDNDDAMCSFYEDLLDRFRGCSTFDAYMHVHARVNLEGLLFREDSSAMAASVEARVPFTDHRLVEYLFSLPDHYKMAWAGATAAEQAREMNIREIDQARLVESKVLLRRAFARELPAEILARKKMSFPVPVREWFGDFLLPFAREAVESSPLVGALFEPETIRRTLATSALPNSGMMLWPVVNLCLWHRWLVESASAGREQEWMAEVSVP